MSKAIVSVQRRRQLERESAVVAEAIEQPAARVPGRRFAVLPLVEKQPGLLPAAEVDVVLDAGLPHGDAVRHVAGDHLHPLLEPFEQTGRADRCARGFRAVPSCSVEEVDDQRQQPIHALRERLDDEVVAVAIDDERRQQIGLAVNQPIRGRIDAERAPERERGVDPALSAARRRPAARRTSACGARSAIDRCTARIRACGREARGPRRGRRRAAWTSATSAR